MREIVFSVLKLLKYHFVVIIVIAIFMLCLALIGVGLKAELENASNKITEGIIVDKNYNSAYSSREFYTDTKGNSYPVSHYHPERFQFTIKGNKNGEMVEYIFDVTENEYNLYKIGDYYKK